MEENEKKLECAECGDSRVGLDISSKLWVKDRFVDALGIDDIMEEVFRMRIKDRNRITEELMSRFLQNNRIDKTLDREYRIALIDEYERRQLPYL
jgi:hypothetical protein